MIKDHRIFSSRKVTIDIVIGDNTNEIIKLAENAWS